MATLSLEKERSEVTKGKSGRSYVVERKHKMTTLNIRYDHMQISV